MPRGRSQEAAQEQERYPGSATSGQLRLILGLSGATMKRAIKDGRIPEPEYTLSNGWRLWSAEQVKILLLRRIERGRV